jgi:hypothetical protein
MADQADVENAIAALVANVLYPAGAASPSAIGRTCRVYRGYPNAPSLDADIAAGTINVSITAAQAPAKNVTRYPQRWISVVPVKEVLSVTVVGTSVTFSGVCAVGQLAGVMVDATLFPYAVQSNDHPATVASNLAALIRSGGWIVTYAGQTIDVPGAERFVARVVAGAGALQEIKRQVKSFQVSMWCPDPATRDLLAPIIDEALSGLNFIPLADGSFGRVIFADSQAQDNAADAALYRRDLTYLVEYPTTVAQVTPAMLFGTATVSANGAVVENVQV